jgi:hypothetical protein
MTTNGKQCPFSEKAVNIVENIAILVAERKQGRIRINDLAPYLPMSLELLKECLDDMTDNSSVFKEEDEDNPNMPVYFFAACENSDKKGAIVCDSCASCSNEKLAGKKHILCEACAKLLKKELNKLADKNAWPAQAVYEHEILYLAANGKAPHYCAKLAGKSNLTVRNMRRKLDKMCVEGFVTQKMDESKGLIEYIFPKIDYPKNFYSENMNIIRSYPASVMEEVEIKLIRILFSISLLGILLFLGSFFFRLPFPIVIVLLLIISPAIAIFIWRKRSKPLAD